MQTILHSVLIYLVVISITISVCALIAAAVLNRRIESLYADVELQLSSIRRL